jgi:hypothetical protein
LKKEGDALAFGHDKTVVKYITEKCEMGIHTFTGEQA